MVNIKKNQSLDNLDEIEEQLLDGCKQIIKHKYQYINN